MFGKRKDAALDPLKEAAERAAKDFGTKEEYNEFLKDLQQNGPSPMIILGFLQEAATVCQTNNKAEFMSKIPIINGKTAVYLSSINPLHWVSMAAAIADAYIRFGEYELATLRYESICEYAQLRFADKKETFGDFYNLSKLYERDKKYKKAADTLEKGLDLYKKAGIANQNEINQYKAEISNLRKK